MSEQGAGGLGRWMDLIRAELRKALSRRATKVLGAACVGGLLLLGWSQASDVSHLRAQIVIIQQEIETLSTDEPDRFGRSPEEARQGLQQSIVFNTLRVHETRQLLQPENSHLVTLGFMGTIPGVGVAVLFASTLFGAEFRWRYWKTALTAEPRRVRLVMAKLVSMWVLLLIALVVLLGLSYPANAAFSAMHGVHDPGSQLGNLLPEPQRHLDLGLKAREVSHRAPLPQSLATAWLTLSFYATLAASLALLVRASLAGLAGGGIFLLEGLLFNPTGLTPPLGGRMPWLRVISPSQQVAYLLPNVGRGQLWYETFRSIIEYKWSVSSGLTASIVQQFSPIPNWRAYLVLGLWTLLAVILAVAALRSRDIPA